MSKENITQALALNLALLCFACDGAGMQWGKMRSDPDLSRRCVASLATFAKSVGATPSSEGDRLRIGKDEVRVSARVENTVPAQSGYLVGLMVDVSINGVAQPLTAGVANGGATREEAAAAAAAIWARLVGIALLDALGIKEKDAPVLSTGRFSAHAGVTTVAGETDGTFSDDNLQELLDKLGGVIRGLEASPSEFHLISILMLVRPDGTTDGECRVDGEVSEEALRAVQSFRWTPAKSEYLLKQYYVLRRRS